MEIGDYYRTKRGGIYRIKTMNTPETRRKKCLGYVKRNILLINGRHTLDDIVSHSKMPKDLVQDGDYVNGYLCRYITDINTGKNFLCNFDMNEMRWIPLEDIDVFESIVTKEQFASMEYKF